MNIDALAVKVLVERELMIGFASPVPFDVDIVTDCEFMDGAVLVLNVFRTDTTIPYELLVTMAVIYSQKALSVEIRNKNSILECDIWESGNTLENVEKTIKSFIKRMISYGN